MASPGRGRGQGRNLKRPSAIYSKEQRETDVFMLTHASLLATLGHFRTPNAEKGAAYTEQAPQLHYHSPPHTDMPSGQPGLDHP